MMSPLYLLSNTNSPKMARTYIGSPAALANRAVATPGAVGAADVLTEAFHQYMKLSQIGGAPSVQHCHYYVVGGSKVGLASDEPKPAQYPEDVRVHDERGHLQCAEIQRGRRHFAANARQSFQPLERRCNALRAKEREVKIRATSRYGAKGTLKMPCLDVRKGDVADDRLDIGRRRMCDIGPLGIDIDKPMIGTERDFVTCTAADRRFDELADRCPHGDQAGVAEVGSQLVPKPLDILESPKAERHLHL